MSGDDKSCSPPLYNALSEGDFQINIVTERITANPCSRPELVGRVGEMMSECGRHLPGTIQSYQAQSRFTICVLKDSLDAREDHCDIPDRIY